MSKSFHVCIKNSQAATIPRTVGGKVRIAIQQWIKPDLLTGEVVRVIQEETGLLVLVLNDGYGEVGSALPGWRIVPIFLSQTSGILLPYTLNSNNSTKHVQDYRALLKETEEMLPVSLDVTPLIGCPVRMHGLGQTYDYDQAVSRDDAKMMSCQD